MFKLDLSNYNVLPRCLAMCVVINIYTSCAMSVYFVASRTRPYISCMSVTSSQLPSGLNDYCANQPLYPILVDSTHNDEVDLYWMRWCPWLNILYFSMLYSVVRMWVNTAETIVEKFSDKLNDFVVDETKRQVISKEVTDTLWRSRGTWSAVYGTYIYTLALLLAVPLAAIVLITYCGVLQQYYNGSAFSRHVACRNSYYGPSGTLQHLDYICTLSTAYVDYVIVLLEVLMLTALMCVAGYVLLMESLTHVAYVRAVPIFLMDGGKSLTRKCRVHNPSDALVIRLISRNVTSVSFTSIATKFMTFDSVV